MDKKRLVEQAKLAEQAERYEDMAKVKERTFDVYSTGFDRMTPTFIRNFCTSIIRIRSESLLIVCPFVLQRP